MNAPLTKQAPDHASLKALRDAGVIEPAAFWEGIRSINQPRTWALWAARLALLVGSALILAALVYFFAFNWDGLDRLQKLGLLQGVTLLALIAGQVVGFRRIGGQLLLMAAAVSVGVGFAVYGQVYQTGADAFGFFGMWAVGILPWVVAGTFAPLWVLWFTLVNLTLWFLWHQIGQFHSFEYSYVCMLLTAVNGSGLIARELLKGRYGWLSGDWLRHLFLLSTLVPLLVPALDLVLDSHRQETFAMILSTALWLACLGAAYRYFTRAHYDGTALCIVLANAAIFLLCGVGRIFEEADLYDSGAGFLLMALIVGGATTLLVRVLRRLKRRYDLTEGNES